jgi:hypothetical protein
LTSFDFLKILKIEIYDLATSTGKREIRAVWEERNFSSSAEKPISGYFLSVESQNDSKEQRVRD